MTNSQLVTDLAGRTVLVTGASAGIGIAIAKTFGACGARVVLIGRNAERLEAVATLVRDAGGEALPLAVDMTSPGACNDIVTRTIDAFGSLDVLVHNAGVFAFGEFETASIDNFDEQWTTNVRGPFALTQAALPHLRSGSTVVFVGSNVTAVGFPLTAAYSATKGAIEALARALAIELAPRGIRINVVSPGMTRTQMTSRLDDDPAAEEAAVAATPVGRIGETQDIANAVVFMASDLSGYVLGSTLVIDGGFTAV